MAGLRAGECLADFRLTTAVQRADLCDAHAQDVLQECASQRCALIGPRGDTLREAFDKALDSVGRTDLPACKAAERREALEVLAAAIEIALMADGERDRGALN